MTESPDAVVDAIRSAFAGVRRGAITLHEAEVLDGYGDEEELALARRLDTESGWEDVPDAAIEECEHALSYLDPISWRYYVPAFMVWSLRHFRTSDSIVTDFTIYTFLTYADDESLVAWATKRFGVLDEAQSRAVCRFLRYMAANDGLCDGRAASTALEQTWGRFCE